MLINRTALIEPVEPPPDRCYASTAKHWDADEREEPLRAVRIAGRLRVIEGRFRLAVLLAPLGRASTKLWNQFGLAPLEIEKQQLAEHLMVSEPLLMPIDRDHQEVLPRHRLEDLDRPRLLQHRVTDRTAHLVDHGRTHQERGDLRLLAIQELRPEVLGHYWVVACHASRD